MGRALYRPQTDDADAGEEATFHSIAGRPLGGGGRIHPDIVIERPATSREEEELIRRLGADVQQVWGEMTTLALEMKGTLPADPADFEVTNQAVAELRRRVGAAGVTLPARAWATAREWVEREFRYRVLRYGYGRSAEMWRRILDDPMVQRAASLTEGAETQADLFAQVTGAGMGDW